MKIYIDENMPKQLANSLNILQQALNLQNSTNYEVLSIKEVFGKGAQDEDWIPLAGKEGAVVITQDFRIQTTRHQRDLYQASGLGILFIKAPKNGLSFWDMTTFLINKWPEILKILKKNKPPFAFRGTQRTRFSRLED